VAVAAAADELVAATTDGAATLEAKPAVMSVANNEVCVTGRGCIYLGFCSVFRTLGRGNNNGDALVAPVAPTRPPSSPWLVSVDAAADEVVAATADDAAAIDVVS
jgi:hypothetical protein